MARRYWENFRAMRESRHFSQEAVARRLGITRQGNLSRKELHDMGVPRPATIRRHAEALECEPWELLVDVETEYDRLRRPPTSTSAESSEGRPAFAQ